MPDRPTPEERDRCPAPKGTVRRYRQELSAILGYLADLHAPISERVRQPPEMIEAGLARLIHLCDEIDVEWAKVDPRAVGGEITLTDDRSPAPSEQGERCPECGISHGKWCVDELHRPAPSEAEQGGE